MLGTEEFYLGYVEDSINPESTAIQVRNKSGYSISPVIERISCGCLSASFSSKKIARGSMGDLLVSMQPKGRAGVLIHTANCGFHIKDGSTLRHQLRVVALSRGWWCVPQQLRIDAASIENGESFNVTIYNLGSADLKHCIAESSLDNVSLSWGSVREKQQNVGESIPSVSVEERSLRVFISPSIQEDSLRGSIRLNTESDPQRQLSVPVILEQQRLIKSEPVKGVVDHVPLGENADVTFALTARHLPKGFDWTEVNVTCDDLELDWELKPSARFSRNAKLRVSIPVSKRLHVGTLVGTIDAVEVFSIPLIVVGFNGNGVTENRI